ncbi:MAG: hypothetical protein GY727_00360 [Gammaproteobacteria bacterium]|nr:hypothetical protein [Gammaproteobacteria bacterium]MCP4090995.1 hypothetical protein [Gammaproteobacteria bacterium]MCP4277479.1 hypothetical protein [Gammaproteobacteria bacterium]MCP4831460.1 hypothetical protein [Gammaproteobacteria bacterium]MCP4928601.1 hypothetical protein [Gammaproteobacteria bacterium]
MTNQTNLPSFQSKNFTCPSCNELSEQTWLNAYVSQVNNPAGVPLRIEGEGLEQLKQSAQFPPDVLEQKLAYWNKVNSGEVFLDRWAPVQSDILVAGMEISVCNSCSQMAVWLSGEIAYPKTAAEK